MTGTDRKVFSRAFRSHWDHENRWRIDGDMAEWSLWQQCTTGKHSHFDPNRRSAELNPNTPPYRDGLQCSDLFGETTNISVWEKTSILSWILSYWNSQHCYFVSIYMLSLTSTRFSSRPAAWLVKFVLKSVCCAPFLQQSVKQQIVLSVRSLCSLPSIVCEVWWPPLQG